MTKPLTDDLRRAFHLKIPGGHGSTGDDDTLLPNRSVGRAEQDDLDDPSRWRCQLHCKAERLQAAHIVAHRAALQALGVEVVKVVGSQVLVGRLIAQHVIDAD
jgi:hypothetical protein